MATSSPDFCSWARSRNASQVAGLTRALTRSVAAESSSRSYSRASLSASSSRGRDVVEDRDGLRVAPAPAGPGQPRRGPRGRVVRDRLEPAPEAPRAVVGEPGQGPRHLHQDGLGHVRRVGLLEPPSAAPSGDHPAVDGHEVGPRLLVAGQLRHPDEQRCAGAFPVGRPVHDPPSPIWRALKTLGFGRCRRRPPPKIDLAAVHDRMTHVGQGLPCRPRCPTKKDQAQRDREPLYRLRRSLGQAPSAASEWSWPGPATEPRGLRRRGGGPPATAPPPLADLGRPDRHFDDPVNCQDGQ